MKSAVKWPDYTPWAPQSARLLDRWPSTSEARSRTQGYQPRFAAALPAAGAALAEERRGALTPPLGHHPSRASLRWDDELSSGCGVPSPAAVRRPHRVPLAHRPQAAPRGEAGGPVVLASAPLVSSSPSGPEARPPIPSPAPAPSWAPCPLHVRGHLRQRDGVRPSPRNALGIQTFFCGIHPRTNAGMVAPFPERPTWQLSRRPGAYNNGLDYRTPAEIFSARCCT